MALVIMEAALGYYPIQSGISHVDVGMKSGYEQQLATSITQYGFDKFYGNCEKESHNLLEQLNPELVAFLSDWLKEERLRLLPQLKIKHEYLRLDGKPISANL